MKAGFMTILYMLLVLVLATSAGTRPTWTFAAQPPAEHRHADSMPTTMHVDTAPVIAVNTTAVGVSIVDFAFNPSDLTIAAGTTVTWTNNGTFQHTSTSDAGLWDSGTLNTGQSFAYTFNTPGIYTYHCTFHKLSMHGTITVMAPVSVVDDQFQPKTLIIHTNDTVIWTNQGMMQHTVTADDNTWTSPTLMPGDTYTHTFTVAGTYPYHCFFHQSVGMVGTVIVLEDRAYLPLTIRNASSGW